MLGLQARLILQRSWEKKLVGPRLVERCRHFFSNGPQGELHGGMAGNLGVTYFHDFLIPAFHIDACFFWLTLQEPEAWYG